MLRRYFLLAAAVSSPWWISACSQAVPTKISVSREHIEQNLQKHFPKKFPIAGLLQLDMQQPQLQLLPDSNQLHTDLLLTLSGAALQQAFDGRLQVRFGLYYEPKDRSVRARHVEVLGLQLQGVSPAMSDMVQAYGLRIAQQALEGFSLYTVKSEDLELADSLGLQPGAIAVTAEGLDVAIESKVQPIQPAQ